MLKKPELLMPANNLEVLKTAIRYGADAVYIGGDLFSLRAKAKNFSREEMREGIDFAHAAGKRVHVTANITAHNGDLEGIRQYFHELKELKPDALIISDPGVFDIAREVVPEIDIHISTQANNVNYGTYSFWHRLGARRAVAARELSLEEISEMRKKIPAEMEIEAFVHGAMCISYSGRCLLSNYLTGRDANLGACTHPCRWKYFLMEESRPGEYMPVEENDRGTFIFNSKDLCMIRHIPEMIEAGIDSLKVEGRMKTTLYVATVARAYRLAIDACVTDIEKYRANLDFYFDEIGKCTNRRFTTGFFFGKPGSESQIYENSSYVKDYVYLGVLGKREAVYDSLDILQAMEDKGNAALDTVGSMYQKESDASSNDVKEWIFFSLEQKNKFSVGDTVEIMKPDGRNLIAKVTRMLDEERNQIESCPHARQQIFVSFESDGDPEPGDIIRTI